MALFSGGWRSLTLRTRLIGLMLILFALTAAFNYLLTSWIEHEALDEVQSHVETLAKAIQVAVQQFPAERRSAEEILKDYQSRLRSSGVEEITLLDAERRIIASTRGREPGRETFTEALETKKELTRYDLTIPVVAQERLLGFASLHLVLDNFSILFRNMLFYKILGSLAVFAVGIVFIVSLVSYLTKPVEALRGAAIQVASGNLDIDLPDPPTPDLNTLVVAFRDMSLRLKEQKILEKRIRDQEQAAELGRMAAGIAHDVRNPLNFVGLVVQHLNKKKGLAADPSVSQLLDQAHSELLRVSSMIQDLLEFGRETKPQLNLEVIGSILEESWEEVQRRRPSGETPVALLKCANDSRALVDRNLLQRALTNLLENAVDASGAGGRIKAGVTTQEQDTVMIWIEDSGPGIPAELQEKVFTPYFTTKPSGVGLGLALVKKWVEEMGGEIRLFSQAGHGCRFEISFPSERS